MRDGIIACQLLSAIVAGSFSVSVGASLIWDWSIDNPVQVVLPTESVVLMATLRNDITSTEYIYGTNIRDQGYWVSNASCCSPALNSQYALSNPGMGGDVRQMPNFFSQFDNMTLAPGESINFVFLNLTPRISAADFGLYDFNARLGLSYLATGVAPTTQYSQTAPSVFVHTVPAPWTAFLLLSGILSLFAWRMSGGARSGDISCCAIAGSGIIVLT